MNSIACLEEEVAVACLVLELVALGWLQLAVSYLSHVAVRVNRARVQLLPMREKRDEIIILRTTKAEKNRIYEKMLGMGIRSLSAYIRKMALDGYCLHLDLKELQRMAYLLQMCSNNLNQYAKRANECGKVYAADMEDLRQRLDELIDIGKQILSKLAEL